MARESNRTAPTRPRRERVGPLEILRWAHGGEGVAIPAEGALAGCVVFVADVVPGDVVEVEIDERKARWARGRVAALVRPSPERVAVPCAVQGRCGGCPWMAGSARAQGASRRAILEGELKKRLGLSEADIAARLVMLESHERVGYRQRLRLTWEVRAGGLALGFLGKKSHALIDVSRCEVADERLNAALPEVRRRAAALGGSGRVTLLAGDEGVAGFFEGQGGARARFGPEVVTTRLGRFAQRLAPEAFAQASGEVTGQMLETLAGWAKAARASACVSAAGASEPWAVELFAGAGTLTMALWEAGWPVVAYELAEGARAGFEATRVAAGVPAERGRWHAADLTLGLPLPAPPAPALVVLDPPRTGAAEIVDWVRGSGARFVVYVSCDLATGLRDLAGLTREGRYRIAEVVGLDMFPHTGHQEVMVLAEALGQA